MPFVFPLLADHETLEEYAECIKKEECIWVVVCCHENLGSQVIIVLADALKVSTLVKELIFSFDRIDNDGLKALAQILRENRSIQAIDFSRNRIGDESRKTLADARESMLEFVEALKINTTLKELNLSDNYIGMSSTQINIFASALPNFNFTKLGLATNGIRNDGMGTLAQALKKNHHLLSINLRANPFGNEGLTALADALDENTHLIEVLVDRDRDDFDPEILKRIDRALARNFARTIAISMVDQASSEKPHTPEKGSNTPSAEVSSSGGSSLQSSGRKDESNSSKSSPDKPETADKSDTEDSPDKKDLPDEEDEEVARLTARMLFFSSEPPAEVETNAESAPKTLDNDPDKTLDSRSSPAP